MTRKEFEIRYEEHGLKDYQLKSLDDLKAVHGALMSQNSKATTDLQTKTESFLTTL